MLNQQFIMLLCDLLFLSDQIMLFDLCGIAEPSSLIGFDLCVAPPEQLSGPGTRIGGANLTCIPQVASSYLTLEPGSGN